VSTLTKQEFLLITSVGLGALLVGTIVTFLTIGGGKATAKVTNASGAPISMPIKFGAGTKAHPFCGGASCVVPIPDKVTINIPTGGKYLNATLAFDAPVGCGATKVELDLNNPKWFDIVDVSLVDGWNRPVEVALKDPSGTQKIGPVESALGNEKAFGVYPLACDICVERQKPPCGYEPGKTGCKSGTQYKPDVPCQYQGTVMGGGTSVLVTVR
jgi:hypothetical protein